MKQHITVEQLNELSDKAKEKLRDWWKPEETDHIWTELGEDYITGLGEEWGRYYDEEKKTHRTYSLGNGEEEYPMYPLLSIGQMIEFLDEDGLGTYLDIDTTTYQDCGHEPACCTHREWNVYLGNSDKSFGNLELCDALWKAVKSILEEEKVI